ncbi:MAG TPA: epimerase, partial [Acidobacteria bacterium]|nr:epimerase [Acidobacteriota bacterium]
GALPVMSRPFRLGLGGPLGDGRQWFPWIHMEDEVGALRFLLEREEARGAFNLAAPHPVTNRELTRTLARVLRRPAFLPAPAFALRLALGEFADSLLGGQRVIPARLLAAGYAFRRPDLESALRDLLHPA